MIDKFSQVAENLPAADRDADRQYHVINGYPVVFSFSKEPNPEAFERMEFFVGNLIVAGLSDWGCVLIPTGLPAELIPHKIQEANLLDGVFC